jgi:high-affinity iron transporter
MFNVTAAPTVLETVAYLAYLVPVLAAFLWPSRPTRSSPIAPSPDPENSQHVPA